MKKFLLISDTHNKHLKIPKEYIENADNSIDTIIHAGDMSGRGYLNEIEPFLDWYNNLNFTNKILIAGNHDLLENNKDRLDSLTPIVDLLNPNFSSRINFS